MICGFELGVADGCCRDLDFDAEEVPVGLMVTEGLGVLNAPVEARWRRSNSSWSFWGRRGGEGPVAKAGLGDVVVKRRREGRRNLGGRRRDILLPLA